MFNEYFSAQEKKDKPNNNNKVESSTPVGASDKSLRLLEKELQDLKRVCVLRYPKSLI